MGANIWFWLLYVITLLFGVMGHESVATGRSTGHRLAVG